MECNRNNIVTAALVGLAVGVLVGVSSVQYAQLVALDFPDPNFAKTQDMIQAYPKIQSHQGYRAYDYEYDIPDHCKDLNPFNRRGILCREFYNQFGTIYEWSDYRSR